MYDSKFTNLQKCFMLNDSEGDPELAMEGKMLDLSIGCRQNT